MDIDRFAQALGQVEHDVEMRFRSRPVAGGQAAAIVGHRAGLVVALERRRLEDAFERLEDIADRKKGVEVSRRSSYEGLSPEDAICEKIKDGYKERAEGAVAVGGSEYAYQDRIVIQTAEVIQRRDPLEFINTFLMKAMNELGDGFARGAVSLPHLLKSADVMKQVMGFLEAYMLSLIHI